MTPRSVAVVLLAAGRGERLGSKDPKAFVNLAGKSLLEHSIHKAIATENLAQLIIVVPEARFQETLEYEKQLTNSEIGIRVVIGGATRQESVSEGLAVLSGGIEVVLIHDSARALAPTELFNQVAKAVSENQTSVVPVLPVVDTLKLVHGDSVVETVDRSNLVRSQTPQGFLAQVLINAHVAANRDFTDDAALVQDFGGTVMTIPGHELAMKITTPSDLQSANSLIFIDSRTGIGADSHRFSTDSSKVLQLGCLSWPGELALEGHSDGDVIAHAIVDALLSAANLGDIGSNFGTSSKEYEGAAGEVFLEQTLKLLSQAGFEPVNVSVQLIGNRPKLAPRRLELESKLSQVLTVPVSVAATTTDGLGFLGNDEGLAAIATALVRKVGFSS